MASTMVHPGSTSKLDPDGKQEAYLEALADELVHKGLRAWITTDPELRPRLNIANPEAPEREVSVIAGDDNKERAWLFGWSDGGSIGLVDNLKAVVETIVRVLGSLRSRPAAHDVRMPGMPLG